MFLNINNYLIYLPSEVPSSYQSHYHPSLHPPYLPITDANSQSSCFLNTLHQQLPLRASPRMPSSPKPFTVDATIHHPHHFPQLSGALINRARLPPVYPIPQTLLYLTQILKAPIGIALKKRMEERRKEKGKVHRKNFKSVIYRTILHYTQKSTQMD